MERLKIEFVGTFAEVNLKAVEWLTSNPQVRLIKEVGPIRGTSGTPDLTSYDDQDWMITVEYEERAYDVGLRDGTGASTIASGVPEAPSEELVTHRASSPSR